jgi:hypothetical protein
LQRRSVQHKQTMKSLRVGDEQERGGRKVVGVHEIICKFRRKVLIRWGTLPRQLLHQRARSAVSMPASHRQRGDDFGRGGNTDIFSNALGAKPQGRCQFPLVTNVCCARTAIARLGLIGKLLALDGIGESCALHQTQQGPTLLYEGTQFVLPDSIAFFLSILHGQIPPADTRGSTAPGQPPDTLVLRAGLPLYQP